MKRISKRRTVSKQQKQARKIQRSTLRRKKNHSLRKKLTSEQKIKRLKRHAKREELKQKKLPIIKRKKNHSLGKRLTPEQKIKRSEKIAKAKKAKQIRKLLNKKNGTKKIKRIQNAMLFVFNPKMLDELAKFTGFIKRAGSEITPFAFMYIVSFGFLGNGTIALTYLTSGLSTHFDIVVTAQALSKRINNACSVKFLKSILQKLISVQLNIGLKNNCSRSFSMFHGVYLQDSTQMTLNEELSEAFKGSGGGASSSALKLDFIYDIANFLVYGVKITSATTNDLTNSKEILKYIKARSLVIRDLGYLTISVLKSIQGKYAYYISRLSLTLNVYLNEHDQEPLDVPKFLNKLKAKGNDSLNIKVYIGASERFETRLVAEKVPAHVTEQRKRKFKKIRKKEPSTFYESWSSYSIFITNIPETMFSGKMIIALYKIRWQIELVFKNFKSDIEINILKGTNKKRIESLVYGRLITIVVMFVIQNYAAHIARNKEISGNKLTKLLMSDDKLRLAIIKNDLTMLLIYLKHDIILVCKQNRSKKTTYKCIEEALVQEKAKKNNIMPLNIYDEIKNANNHFQKAV